MHDSWVTAPGGRRERTVGGEGHARSQRGPAVLVLKEACGHFVV